MNGIMRSMRNWARRNTDVIGVIWIRGGKEVRRMGLAIRWMVGWRNRIGESRHGTICEKDRPMIEFINEGGPCKNCQQEGGKHILKDHIAHDTLLRMETLAYTPNRTI